MKPHLLDLFCGAGGAARGYQRAGFYVVGVDINPQPRYAGDEFVQADALNFPLEGFDVIHASPPCERFSRLTPRAHRPKHPDLIACMRDRLQESGKPFVIENVPDARHLLRNPVMLCGRMFGLGIERHRYFEIEPPTFALLPPCDHSEYPTLISGTHRRTTEPRYEYTVAQCRRASGIKWMTRTELDKAIPPAYTEWIGARLREALLVSGAALRALGEPADG